jgi:dihydroorotate dehydrogenase electron transfer subunit
MFIEDAEITRNDQLTSDIFSLILYSPLISKEAKPGNFLQIKISDTDFPLLRRPFSIANRIDNDSVEIIYKIKGLGTNLLLKKRIGGKINLIGPLGNSFTICQSEVTSPLQKNLGIDSNTLLIAGGMGIAPLIFLASILKEMGINFQIFYGAKTKSELIYIDLLRTYTDNVSLITDDGSSGKKGLVTEFVVKELKNEKYVSTHHNKLKFYTCGPHPMLKEICRICNQLSIDCEISLEENMACGFGACMGCVTNTLTGYKRVCYDGPVFEAKELIFD